MSTVNTMPSEPTVPVSPAPIGPPPNPAKLPWLLLGLLLFVLVGGGGIFLGRQMVTSNGVAPTPTVMVIAPTPSVNPTANWQTYSTSNFSFKYPSDWKIGQPAHFPDNLILQPAVSFNPELQKDRILISTGSSCLNTQCLTILNLDDYVKQWNAKLVSQTMIDGMAVDKVSLATGETAYMIVIGKTAINISTDKYFSELDQILSSFKFADQNSQVSSANQTAVKNVVTNFYNALSSQDGKTLFSLMTPPVTADEKENYGWLTGTDVNPTAGYRVFLRLKISNPQITSIQQVNANTFTLNLTDQLQGYSNAGATVGWGSLQPRNNIVMTVVNSNGIFMVDKFTDTSGAAGNAATPKYNGFGQ